MVLNELIGGDTNPAPIATVNLALPLDCHQCSIVIDYER